MRTNGAQRPVLVLALGSVVGFAVLVGGSQLTGVQPIQECADGTCTIQFPLHRDGQRLAGSGSAVAFHVPITVVSLVDKKVRLLIGVHRVSLPVGGEGEAGGLIAKVTDINDWDTTVTFALAPGGRVPGTLAH